MRILPNMTVVVPADAREAYKATMQAALREGPVYIRLGRNPAPVLTKADDPFEIGKALVHSQGKDVTIIACGHSLYEAKKAKESLLRENIDAEVINLHTPKPLDGETVLRSARKTGRVVTVEEHTVFAGMGSAVSEYLSQNFPVPMKMLGIKDRFGESGEPLELLKHFNLTTDDVVNAVRQVLKMK